MTSAAALAVSLGTVLFSVLFCAWNWRKRRRELTETMEELERMIEAAERGEAPSALETGSGETLPSRLYAELQKLAAMYQAAERASRRQKEEVQQTVSDISHQLRGPMAGLLMYQEMLRDENLDKETRLRCLDVMEEQIQKLDFLVKALVKLSRLESAMIRMNRKEENLFQCLARAVASVSERAEKKHTQIHIDCPEGLILPLDAKWTSEAVVNVLDNAVKYMKEGGNVTIRAVPLELFVRVDITDQGPGIPEEDYSRIFQRFWRGPETGTQEGVGIGLYLTREIVTRQGGYVKVASCPGKGSTFSLYFQKRD